jgi:hypothetical protein
LSNPNLPVGGPKGQPPWFRWAQLGTVIAIFAGGVAVEVHAGRPPDEMLKLFVATISSIGMMR